MACTKEYLAYILEQLSETDGISHKAMMGEYILYHRGKIAAYLCDNDYRMSKRRKAFRQTDFIGFCEFK